MNIRGLNSGGILENLPVCIVPLINKSLSAEIPIFRDIETQLSNNGFIPLSPFKNNDYAVFFSANSAHKPLENDVSAMFSTKLPYLFLVCRLFHFLKVFQREVVGLSKDKDKLKEELNKWIRKFVTTSSNPGKEQKEKFPLRDAFIDVKQPDDTPGFFQISMKVQPHIQVEDYVFYLSFISRLPLS